MTDPTNSVDLERQQIIAALREMVSERLAHSAERVEDDTNLFDAGVFDSFTLISLIGGMEHRFAISIAVEDLTHESFSTLGSTADLVLRLREV